MIYYPDLGESIGRLRAVVSAILASGEVSHLDRVRFGEVLGNVNRSLERIRGIHRFFQSQSGSEHAVLSCFAKNMEPNLMGVLNFSNTLLSDQMVNTDPRFFFSVATKVIEQNVTCQHQLHDQLRTTFAIRLEQIRFHRDFVLGVALVLVLFMFGFITDFYRRNRRAIVDLAESREEIVRVLEVVRNHRDKLAYERDIVESTLEKINQSTTFDHKGASFLSAPLERISGDFLLSATRPDGVRHYMLGDFTGHGLPSALGSPMVSDIFYTMTRKNFDPLAIMTEINTKMLIKLPRQLYLAVAFLAHDPTRKQLLIWNCGIPELLHFRQNTCFQAYPSRHVPLGILAEHELESVMQRVDVLERDRVYAFSDGFVEAQNRDGVMFGVSNLQKTLGYIIKENQPLSVIMEQVQHHQTGPRNDDLTLLELVF
ncbi:MAG: serine/threonine-protein phosphatase [Magnetococcales bacterium]|nr:serine/threonine-protein phosphatase [Magnetococcales bacterium]